MAFHNWRKSKATQQSGVFLHRGPYGEILVRGVKNVAARCKRIRRNRESVVARRSAPSLTPKITVLENQHDIDTKHMDVIFSPSFDRPLVGE